LDESNSGRIYLGRDSQILMSQDFGQSFDPYISLESNVTGIYKKPKSEIIFVSTIDHIYQINNMELTTLKVITRIPDADLSIAIPITNRLDQNYPNPFNSTTIIKYHISHTAHVEIRIYSVDGKLIDTLVDRQMIPGIHLVNWEAKKIASAVYFYSLFINRQIKDTQRLLLIK
jgi:hypothetical protein